MLNQPYGTKPGSNTPKPTTNGLETAPEKRQYLAEVLKIFPGNSSEAQCQRLREALSHYPLSTFEAMRYLDCYYPPARVMQLRDAGVLIDTHWISATTESGKPHRIGLYVLTPSAGGTND